MTRFSRLSVVAAALLAVACLDNAPAPAPGSVNSHARATTVESKIDRLLSVVLAKNVTVANAKRAMPGKLVRLRTKGGVVKVDVLIKGSTAALAKIKQLGGHVRTVTSSGIMTATVPLSSVRAIAALAEVTRVEAARRMTKLMDVSLGSTGLNVPAALRPAGAAHTGGAGVVVAVLDTGIDWNHADFRNEDGTTRIHAVWDQSDVNDGNPPDASKNYGHVYDKAAIQACIDGTGGYCGQKDTDGHGSHVAGTAAGNGRAHGAGTTKYQHAGVAPEATLVIVKFDFDGDRNSDTAIIDGIDWIFQQAAALGKPAVVNLSLGTDFGPHDGSTLEERGIDDLTGPGKIVVAAAGNPGRTGDPANVGLWGYPLHGSSTIPQGGYSEITFEVPAGAAAGDYVFLLGWYSGSDKTQIQVITPSGAAYPSSFKGRSRATWTTGSPTTFFRTSEGSIIVGNGGDQVGWGTNNNDHELYVELSDYDNTALVAGGTWKIRIYDRGVTNGTYHAWHGTSRALTTARPFYDGTPTNNQMTVGSPATAHKVIAIGAYATKMSWEYLDLNDTDGTCAAGTPCCMTYNTGALSYYDAFYTDSNGDGLFDHTYNAGSCTLASSEPYNNLAFFSGRGPSRDGRQKPAVSAPGVGIVASLSQAALAVELAEPDPNKTYFRRTNRVLSDGLHSVLQGTSMASPHGAGAVGLLLAKNALLTPAEVRNVLTGSARADSFTGTTPNNDWGSGKLDVTAALAATPDPPQSCTVAADCTGDDGNACTVNTCNAGYCSLSTPAADNTSCGGSNICCSGGCQASSCASDSDCAADQVCDKPGTCEAKCVSACELGQPGDSCSDDGDCCSGRCKGRGGNKTCK